MTALSLPPGSEDRVVSRAELAGAIPRVRPGWPPLALGIVGYARRDLQRRARRNRFPVVVVYRTEDES